MGRKATVGARVEHSQFAKDITSYVDAVRVASGMSIRKLAERTAGQRGNSWWAEIFNGTKILTTNDVSYIATELLGISPWELVADARRRAMGQPFTVRTFNVGGTTDDDYQQQATAEQSIPTRRAAKQGTPKARKAFEGDDEGSTSDGGESGP